MLRYVLPLLLLLLPVSGQIRGVDHVVVRCTSTAQAERLLKVFTDQLGVPLAWPAQDFPGFFSGGVKIGSMNLEFFYSNRNPPGEAQLWNVVLDPGDLGPTLELLKEHNVATGEPVPFRGPGLDGKVAHLWTTATLPNLVMMSMCQYLPDFRATWAPALEKRWAASKGGRHGIREVAEIVVGMPAGREEEFGRMAAPVKRDGDGVWRFPAGPPVRVVRTEKPEVVAVRIVTARPAAVDFEKLPIHLTPPSQ